MRSGWVSHLKARPRQNLSRPVFRQHRLHQVWAVSHLLVDRNKVVCRFGKSWQGLLPSPFFCRHRSCLDLSPFPAHAKSACKTSAQRTTKRRIAEWQNERSFVNSIYGWPHRPGLFKASGKGGESIGPSDQQTIIARQTHAMPSRRKSRRRKRSSLRYPFPCCPRLRVGHRNRAG